MIPRPARGRRTLGGLSAVIALDQLHGYAFVVFAPEIARSLHVSTNGLAAVALARGVGFVAIAAVVGTLVHRGYARRVARYGAVARAAALIVGSVATTASVVGGLAAYGSTGATGVNAHRRLLPARHHEVHRLAGRLGNVGVALLVGALAYVLPWSGVFMLLAAVAGVAAMLTIGIGAADHGDDDVDASVLRLAEVPGGRFALGAIAASALVEFPMYIVVFVHMGTDLHVSVMGRALLIAVAELLGVVANVGLGRRLNGAQPRSPQLLGLALVPVVLFGFGAVVAAMTLRTPTLAIAALCVGTLATSVTVPLLALGTRAVLVAAVPRRVSFVTTAALVAVLVTAPANAAAVVALLAVLPILAALSVAAVAVRSPVAVAHAVAGVANVTPEQRMTPSAAVLYDT